MTRYTDRWSDADWERHRKGQEKDVFEGLKKSRPDIVEDAKDLDEVIDSIFYPKKKK